MPTYQIKPGDNLSAIAAANNTTVEALMLANQGNTAVKSRDLIQAGGMLNLPGETPTNVAAETPAGDLATGTPQPGGKLSNLRLALRKALTEAGRKRIETNLGVASPLIKGAVPGSLGGIVNLVRTGVQTSVQDAYQTTVEEMEREDEAKAKELGKIQELRLEYGSAIPSNITSLDDAIAFVEPLVDEERKLKLKKLKEDQDIDNDVESYATSYANGEIAITSVPQGIRSQVLARSKVLGEELQGKLKTEYQDGVTFRFEQGITDFNTERQRVINGEETPDGFDLSGLAPAERREYLDWLDAQEEEQKAAKKPKPKPGTRPLFIENEENYEKIKERKEEFRAAR